MAIPCAPLQTDPAGVTHANGQDRTARPTREARRRTARADRLLIHSCSMPCRKVVEESAAPTLRAGVGQRRAARGHGIKAAVGLAKSASKVCHPAGVLRSPSSPVDTAPVHEIRSIRLPGQRPDLAAKPTAMSRMSSNTSAFAVGAPTSGLRPKREKPFQHSRPERATRARRRALALAADEFPLLCLPERMEEAFRP